MMKTPENFEVPAQVREMAEKGVEQARKAYDEFASAASEAASKAEASAESMRNGAVDLNKKALAATEESMNASFDLATNLVKAKDIQEVLELQTKYVQSQMQRFGEVARELGEAATKTAVDATKKD
ncbi:phasin [Cohaesibacter sp. CAU 1516]|uniref:phasin family protein n=1 Tax=Cohaesibacter sp. CAU 1516 TaxID=2576038 RepID=UPI0010FD21C8|nr:TIGR01841 family phasin [Cohaesibacter sp. CAU 1516]TLP43843.1 phasin [Cohaesibacter sp. CAU 1516]